MSDSSFDTETLPEDISPSTLKCFQQNVAVVEGASHFNHSMNTLCKTFRQQASWTWKQLGRARKVHASIGEESLTDFNLLEIQSRHANQIATQTFNKKDESVEGADWEWWFTGRSNKWLGFRLQAKRIELRSNSFEYLHKKTKGHYQSDALCDRATNASPPRIPLYCLYSHWTSLRCPMPWQCGSFAGKPESYGCSLVDAFDVKKIRATRNSKRLSTLLPMMIPWHCLVCCEAFAKGEDLPTRALAFWRKQIRAGKEKHAIETAVELSSEPPLYVRQLLENQLDAPPDPFVRTITVFNESEDVEFVPDDESCA